MEKLDSIRKCQIWLNVFRRDDGEIVITFCKSYPTTNGWKMTDFVRPGADDKKRILEALQEYYSKAGGIPGGILPLGFCQRGKTR